MIYTVVWLLQAESELASIWLQAPDQNAVTDAANRIDRFLRRDPDRKGQPLDDTQRVLIDSPLRVMFTVSPDDRLVTITQVELI